ncbi:hypothetical protein KIN20_037159 [Parelaphostrongylus tenuis]|uniref:Uncharacterized protein n=1 Tax=Parelaphostrongylus tenuis TaxID=148309 RepID=A0AAD5RDW3_PARTN|nr:hypothetical protein KIN20_037159 [Parelaphostrongylus tenuis]
MAYPARRGGERGLSNSWTATEGRPQGARVLRVDQTLRFLQYSIPRPSSRPPHYLPFNTGAVRASLLTNEPTTVVIRRPSVVTGNTVSTATASSGRLHFVYPRNHPYRRYVTRALNHGRSTFSGRSTTQAIDANSVAGLGGREHNNTPCNVEGQPGSSSTANQKPQKSFTLVRDEYGQLRRVKRLPDGTLFIKKRPPGYLISEQGGISSKSGPGAELQRAQSEVGTVLNAQSTAGTHGKKTGKKVDQRRRSEEFSTSCNRCTSASEQNELHQSRILQNSDPVTQTRRKNRRKDVLYRNDDNETEVNVTLPDDLVPRRRRQGPAHGSREELLECHDDDSIVDVVTVDAAVDEAIKELIALKLGRPFKKFRGRFAKEKQAIRDAKRAEKVAIEQRELPGLDLLLKAIEDSTLELPIEFVDSSVIHDTNLLHEVGEVLKELVAEVSLEELRPKTSRSRRCWDHLPGRCLCNDDPRYAGFSPMPYMGQCSIESSDLSGIAIGGNVRKRRRKVEPSSPTCDQCTVSTRKRKVMRLEAEQDCTLKLIPAYGTNVALPELWRRMNCVDSEGRFGVVANTCRLTRLTATMPKDPIVLLEPDMMSPLHLALPAFEGTLASAFMQYEAGVKSILDQLQCTKSVVEEKVLDGLLQALHQEFGHKIFAAVKKVSCADGVLKMVVMDF